jgi:hypothetical protein
MGVGVQHLAVEAVGERGRTDSLIQPYAARRLGQKVVLSRSGNSGTWGCSTDRPPETAALTIASLTSSSRARIRHSRRSLSLRTGVSGMVLVNLSQAMPASVQSSLARFSIAASSILVIPTPPHLGKAQVNRAPLVYRRQSQLHRN